MSTPSVRVTVSRENKCIYEINKSVDLKASELNGLISDLKDTQIKINNFLTSLVEKEDSSNVENPLSSESDSDCVEEIEEVNPKKCKLID